MIKREVRRISRNGEKLGGESAFQVSSHGKFSVAGLIVSLSSLTQLLFPNWDKNSSLADAANMATKILSSAGYGLLRLSCLKLL